MKLTLLHLCNTSRSFQKKLSIIIICSLSFAAQHVAAQGTWTALKNLAPGFNGGGILLLSNGTQKKHQII